MMEISFSSSFKKTFKKIMQKKPYLEAKFWKKVEIFKNDPFNDTIKTHKLSGKLKDLWSFSIDYDNRVIFYFADDSKNKVVFVDIGSHDVVY